jgi:hypothetical protein
VTAAATSPRSSARPGLQGWLVVESASVSYGKATSYLPVIDLLKGYFKIQEGDDLREIREKVTGKLLALDRTLEPMLPALLACSTCPWMTPPGGRSTPRSDGSARWMPSSGCCSGRRASRPSS